MEAHLSSELTAQSEVQTRMGTFNLKWLIYRQRFKCRSLCRCVCLQRKNRLTWQLEPLEIWVKELLKARVRKINTRPEDCVKHLQSVLCTDGNTFHRNSSKSLNLLCWNLCVCVYAWEGCVYVSCVQTYHSGTRLSRQDCLTRTNQASVWGPKMQIKNIK